jgi:hypothetical protein
MWRSSALEAEMARAHVRGLTELHALAIAGRLAAGGTRGVASLLGYSERQARRRWVEVMEAVMTPLGLYRHDEAATGLWLALHRDCCAKRAFELLRTDARFTSEITSDLT